MPEPDVALLFPGQGSQYVGMGKALAGAFPEVRELFEAADGLLGLPLSEIAFEGPETELRLTKNTQPAILVHSLAVWRLLEENGLLPRVGMAAGHSLGEFSALLAANVLGFEDGVRLVRLRGELMYQAGLEWPGTMAAILGLGQEGVEELCREASSRGVVVPANFNSPEQIVISGEIEAVHEAMALARERGAARVVELEVSGAFHSPLMAAAEAALAERLRSIPMGRARFPVVSNVSAEPITEGKVHRECLIQQLTHPVRWAESVARMVRAGFTTFLEVGPGRVLAGLVKRLDRRAICYPVGDPPTLAEVLERLG